MKSRLIGKVAGQIGNERVQFPIYRDLGKVAQKPISQVPLPIGAPKEFTEVVNIRGACVADDKIPEASVDPCLGIEGQLPAERGSRIQPA